MEQKNWVILLNRSCQEIAEVGKEPNQNKVKFYKTNNPRYIYISKICFGSVSFLTVDQTLTHPILPGLFCVIC